MKRNLQDSRAIVTGASSGIGHALTLDLARHGVGTVVVARREDRLRELAEQVVALGRPVEVVVGDITDPATRQQALDAAQSKLGGLDILVNNAGVGATGLFEDAKPERVRRVMETNFFALVEMTRLALPAAQAGRQADRRSTSVRSSAIAACPTAASIAPASSPCMVSASRFGRSSTRHWGSTCWSSAPARPKPSSSTASSTARPSRNGRNIIPSARPKSRGRSFGRCSRAATKSSPIVWGRVLCWLNRLSPRLVDRIMARYV